MRPRLRALLLGMLHQGADVDEVIQETLVKIAEADRRPSTPIDNAQGFVFVVARNVARDWIRHSHMRRVKSRLVCHEMQSESPEDLLEFEQQRAMLLRAMQSLPECTRDVLRLKRGEQLTHRQIAEQLGLSERQVKMHLQRAMVRLARKLER